MTGLYVFAGLSVLATVLFLAVLVGADLLAERRDR